MQLEGAALVAAVRDEPSAPVRRYDGWTVADLARHVGQIHRWVTAIVTTGATERPAVQAPAVDDEDLATWLTDTVAALVAALTGADPSAEVWTFGRGTGTNEFWRRRMALETALHRWDAQDAQGLDPDVADWLAHEGVEEALRLYIEQQLEGRDVGGSGERVGFDDGRDEGWTLELVADGVAVHDGLQDTDAVVEGAPLDLWLLLCGRRALDGLEVHGDHEAAALAVRAAGLVPGPAG